ncbi:MAG: cache domain-containing protein [Bryobacterales bacterium]|nr:cache domain-containing protein [Bryobacterales bacterium]
MRLSFLSGRPTLKARLIAHYLVVLGIGGLVTSVVGSYIVSSTIMTQVRRSVDNDLVTARTIYEEQLQTLRLTVQLAASGTTIPQYLAGGRRELLLGYLDGIRRERHFDFLTLTDRQGRVVLRSSQPESTGDDASSMAFVAEALKGATVASTEILPAEALGREDARLRRQARVRLIATPRSRYATKAEETSGMALVAATPVRGPAGELLGALYGGVLLNRNFTIVDRAWQLLYQDRQFEGRQVGTVTIFQHDVRISTNVLDPSGERAVGTMISAEVDAAVMDRGQVWRGRAFVVQDWFISRYDPIRDLQGRTIGALYVGVLERAYTAIRDRVILSFFAIATIGFVLIIATTYYEISHITRPVGQMVAATRNIAAGNLDQEVEAGDQGEIALLAQSFNTMLKSLRAMRDDLEEWGRTLEQKVRERTEELVAMQARVSQSERLASLGMLAAGVAHEINNPLGGILALTSLTLEDLPPEDPNRENLEEVVHQSQRCRGIVKGLLEFSRQSHMSAEIVDLNKVLDDTLSLIAKQAAFFNVEIVKEYDPGLKPVLAGRSELQQVFMNILMNAAQAMDEQGTIRIVTRNAAEDAVEVLVSDTGHGIPPEHVDRIFDPFFSTKPSGQGTGLGLSISYGIITSLKGTIHVESVVGKGTTFTIRMPAALGIAGNGQA